MVYLPAGGHPSQY